MRHLLAVAFNAHSDSKEIMKAQQNTENKSETLKQPEMKQTNRFTWKKLSTCISQKYKVEESCRQNERITPFIHFFSSFSSSFAQSCGLFYILPSGP